MGTTTVIVKRKENIALLKCLLEEDYCFLTLERLVRQNGKWRFVPEIGAVMDNDDTDDNKMVFVFGRKLSQSQIRIRKKNLFKKLKKVLEKDNSRTDAKKRKLKEISKQVFNELKEWEEIEHQLLIDGEILCMPRKERDIVLTVGRPHRLDFMFPDFSLFFMMRGTEESDSNLFVIRNVEVPHTHLDIDTGRLKGVYWVIPYRRKKDSELRYIAVNYPFNTDRKPCSPLFQRLNLTNWWKQDDSLTALWYAEPPNTDLVSIMPERLPLLLYFLKEKKHEFLPLVYRERAIVSFGKTVSFKPNCRYRITVKTKNGENTFRGTIPEKRLPEPYVEFLKETLPTPTRIEGTVEVENISETFRN